MVDRQDNQISVRHQCELLDVPRQRLYYKPKPISEETLSVMDFIDRRFTEHPTLGVDVMVEHLSRDRGLRVNHKRVRRLMRTMGLMAIYPKPRTSLPAAVYHKYPCLLGALTIDRPDVVWCSDITYIRLKGGFMYLVAIMDYYSRYVLSWSVSNSLDSLFCLDALDEAMRSSTPQVFHSDQGRQYTSSKFIDALTAADIRISMSGKGRAFDNILAERLWRTVKYEEVYLHQYADGHELIAALERYFDYYNNRRLHQSLGYQTPAEVYFGNRETAASGSAAAAMTPTSFGQAHSRPAAGPSHTRLYANEPSVVNAMTLQEDVVKIVTTATLNKRNFGIENG
jgi:putative transposase